jgi:hypothetical protein
LSEQDREHTGDGCTRDSCNESIVAALQSDEGLFVATVALGRRRVSIIHLSDDANVSLKSRVEAEAILRLLQLLGHKHVARNRNPVIHAIRCQDAINVDAVALGAWDPARTVLRHCNTATIVVSAIGCAALCLIILICL